MVDEPVPPAESLDASPDAPVNHGSVRHGVVLLLLLHLLQLVWLLDEPILMLFTGVTQLAYLVPATVVLVLKARWKTIVGMWLTAVLTLAANLAVFYLVFDGTTGIGG